MKMNPFFSSLFLHIHGFFFKRVLYLELQKYYPCLCLCLGLKQITIMRPRLRIRRHFSQILRTEALIFIFIIPYLHSESIFFFYSKKVYFIFELQIISLRRGCLKEGSNRSNLFCEAYKLYVPWLNHNDSFQF